MWINGIEAALAVITLVKEIAGSASAFTINEIPVPAPIWVVAIFLAAFAGIHALPVLWLGSRGTREAFYLARQEGAISLADVTPRSAATFWLLRLLHLPLMASIAIVLLSLHRPPSTGMPFPSHAAKQFGWFQDRMRWESWDEPFEVSGSYGSHGSYTDPDAVFAAGSNAVVTSLRKSKLRVLKGTWIEFRPRQAIWWTLFLSILVAVTELIWRRNAKHRIGLCPKCGYDLRATPERCPECGHETRKIQTGAAP
jgi:hypothetical protein